MQVRRSIITIFSIVSILFGTFGAVFSFGSIFFLNSNQESFENVHGLSLSVAGTVKEASAMLENSDDTSRHIADSIRITRDSIDSASEIAYDSGMAFNEIAGVVGFDILGIKPLETTEEYFEDIGNNLVTLSEDLKTAEESLEINTNDLERIGRDLENISAELNDVSTRFDALINRFSILRMVTVLKYLLVYLGILNIIFVLNGIMFLGLRR